jgi:hypothetical protein
MGYDVKQGTKAGNETRANNAQVSISGPASCFRKASHDVKLPEWVHPP